MTDCRACGGRLEKGQPFILERQYPGLTKRYFNMDFYGMDRFISSIYTYNRKYNSTK